MVSSYPINEYMQRHGCGFPDALEALAARIGPPTARDVRRALQTLGRGHAIERAGIYAKPTKWEHQAAMISVVVRSDRKSADPGAAVGSHR